MFSHLAKDNFGLQVDFGNHEVQPVQIEEQNSDENGKWKENLKWLKYLHEQRSGIRGNQRFML